MQEWVECRCTLVRALLGSMVPQLHLHSPLHQLQQESQPSIEFLKKLQDPEQQTVAAAVLGGEGSSELDGRLALLL